MAFNFSRIKRAARVFMVSAYLKYPAYGTERKAFVEQEITYTDAILGRRTAEFILKVLGKKD